MMRLEENSLPKKLLYLREGGGIKRAERKEFHSSFGAHVSRSCSYSV